MSSLIIEGNVPLIGTVETSGSKTLSLKLIYAALFANEDVVLDNVPRIKYLEDELEIVRSVGATANWIGKNTLLINGSTINSYKIPYKIGCKHRSVFLFAGVLLHRFGKAFIPKIQNTDYKVSPVNRFLNIWDSLGVIYAEDDNYYMLSSENLSASTISFKLPTHMGTDAALLTSLFISGETIINNTSEDLEVEELTQFLNDMGASIERLDPRRIKVTGKNIFKGCRWLVSPDKTEAITFGVAALLTNGNVLIKGVDREALTSFVHFLMKIGAHFEFVDNGLKVWRAGETFTPSDVTASYFPGIISDWVPALTLLLCKAEGDSLIHDTVYTDRFGFIKDLNRMGAKIDILPPSKVGKTAVINDDSYDLAKMGEPLTILKVRGPSKLKGSRLDVPDLRYGALPVLAALAADGKSEIFNFEKVLEGFEDFFDKLKNLGARISYVDIE